MVRKPPSWLLPPLAAALIAGPVPAATEHRGRVVSVNEGDMLTVLVDGREQLKIRLLGIDAPESIQDFAKQSQSSLGALAAGREVRVENLKRLVPGQARARVWAAEPGCSQPDCPQTLDLGLAQVAAGMAWQDPGQEKDLPAADRQRYVEAQFMAKVRRLGLWAGKNPMAPWLARQRRLEE